MPWPKGLTSQHKLTQVCKFAYGLAKGWAKGFTEIGSPVHASYKKLQIHTYTDNFQSTCVELHWVGQMVKILPRLTYKFELDQV